MVPRRGLEPPQYYYHRYLKPARLPFRHLGAGKSELLIYQYYGCCQTVLEKAEI